MKSIAFVIATISTLFGILPSLIAFLKIKSADEIQRLLRILVWGATLCGLSAMGLAKLLHINNLFILHFYTIFDLVMLTLIFRNYIGRNLSRGIIILFVTLAATNSIFVAKFNSFNVLARSIEAFIIICYALTFFTLTLKRMDIVKLNRSPMFWISCGALLYYAASFFIFIFSQDIQPMLDIWYIYWGIHAIFTIVLYIFYSIALWVQPEK